VGFDVPESSGHNVKAVLAASPGQRHSAQHAQRFDTKHLKTS
jgi:hypothetical protein